MMILKTNQKIIVLLFIIGFFSSCKGQAKGDDTTCRAKFRLAREIAYGGSVRSSALDSAIALLNETMQCDSIRKAVVDFKITVLVSMRKYKEALSFVDSLKVDDFAYDYKKEFIKNELKALELDLKSDTSGRDLVYKEISGDIEQYVNAKKDMGSSEFMEVFTDLFTIKRQYMNLDQISKYADSLKTKYPDKKQFFDFLAKE